jgi:ElaB/YqjD/DUF883 family membrane-anchored ribosome-binding protein
VSTLVLIDRVRYVQEHHHMKSQRQSHPSYGFAIGLAAGLFVGAGVAIWLAPRSASTLRERITRSVKQLGQRASNEYEQARTHYEQASSRVGEAVEAFTRPRAL